MQQDRQQEPEVKAIVLLQIDTVFMHRLLRNQKTLFTSGTCKLAKLQNNRAQPVFFLNLNSFYYGIHPDSYFIKVPYFDTVAYVFPHFQNGLSAISVPANCQAIPQLDALLGQAARLVDYKTAMEVGYLRDLIIHNYPDLEKEQIYYPDSIKKVITKAGSFFGSAFEKVGDLVKNGVEKAGNYLNTKITEGEPTHFQESTKQKLHRLKEGTSNFINVSTEIATKILNPVVTKAKQYSNQIEQKINRSNNQTIKYAKQLAQVSGRAIGQAFEGLVKGGTQVASELGAQGKKIITKKYGNQVIKTFSGEQEKRQNQAHAEQHKEKQKEQQKKQHKEQHKEKQKEQRKEKDKVEVSAQLQDSSVRLNDVSSENSVYPNLDK